MLADEPEDNLGILRVLNLVQVHLAAVAVVGERAVGVVHVGDPAGHSRGEVAAGGPENHRVPARHVLATVVAHALDHGSGARVADAEALGSHPAEERLARGGSVERDVTDDDGLVRVKGGGRGGLDDDVAAAEALADVIVGVAGDLDGDALAHERA